MVSQLHGCTSRTRVPFHFELYPCDSSAENYEIQQMWEAWLVVPLNDYAFP